MTASLTEPVVEDAALASPDGGGCATGGLETASGESQSGPTVRGGAVPALVKSPPERFRAASRRKIAS